MSGAAPARAPAAAVGLPVVSVVIPCYLQAHFLPATLASVVGQTGAELDVVVVDDGSPDDVAGAARAFPDVRVLRQEHAGLSAARNAGARAARGDYLIFLDADDLLLPGAVEAGLAALAARPDAAFAVGGYVERYADGTEDLRNAVVGTSGDLYAALLRRNVVGCPAAALYRRSTVAAAGDFDASVSGCEDWEYYLRIVRARPYVAHAGPVAVYYRHGAGMSRNNALMLGSALAVLRRQRPFVRGSPERAAALDVGVATVRGWYEDPIVRALLDAAHSPHSWPAAARLGRALVRAGGAPAAGRVAGLLAAAAARRARAVVRRGTPGGGPAR